jgi:hypothetical protein
VSIRCPCGCLGVPDEIHDTTQPPIEPPRGTPATGSARGEGADHPDNRLPGDTIPTPSRRVFHATTARLTTGLLLDFMSAWPSGANPHAPPGRPLECALISSLPCPMVSVSFPHSFNETVSSSQGRRAVRPVHGRASGGILPGVLSGTVVASRSRGRAAPAAVSRGPHSSHDEQIHEATLPA